jgi:hypothetical protein
MKAAQSLSYYTFLGPCFKQPLDPEGLNLTCNPTLVGLDNDLIDRNA